MTTTWATSERLTRMSELANDLVADGFPWGDVEKGLELAELFLALEQDMAAAGFPPEEGPPEGECDCARYPEGVLCRTCKLRQYCDGCRSGAVDVAFERVATGELLCPVCATVDAGAEMPEPEFEDRVGEWVTRWLGRLRHLLGAGVR